MTGRTGSIGWYAASAAVDFTSRSTEPGVAADDAGALLVDPQTRLSIEALLVIEQSALQTRRGAEERRQLAEHARERSEDEALGAMREQARDTLLQGVLSGLVTAAAGGLELVGVGYKAAGDAEAFERKARLLEQRYGELRTRLGPCDGQVRELDGLVRAALGEASAARRATLAAGAVQAIAETVRSGKDFVEGSLGAAIKEDELHQREHDSASRRCESQAHDAEEIVRHAEELVNKALKTIEALLSADHEGAMAVVRFG